MVQVLKHAATNLTRENVMRQAAGLKNFSSDVLLPGIKINYRPNDFFPIEQMQLMKFNGESWSSLAISSRESRALRSGHQSVVPFLDPTIRGFPAPRATQAGLATVASPDSRLRPESPPECLPVRC